MNTATETLLAFWKEPRNIPFKGHLISEEPPKDGEEPVTCMCAQGQALHIVGGYSEEDLRSIGQGEADREVAKLLGISVAHSVLLRKINDSRDGAPSDVLTNPEKYLGPNYETVLKFWRFMDSLTEDNWREVAIRFATVRKTARRGAAAAVAANIATTSRAAAAAIAAVAATAVDAAIEDAVDAAAAAAYIRVAAPAHYRVIAAEVAAGAATCELIGNTESPIFVPLFDNLGA